MTIDSKLLRSLEAYIKEESKLYESYLLLLSRQGQHVTKFDLEKLTALNLKRKEHSQHMARAQEKRVRLMEQFPDSAGKRLSELITIHCEPVDQQRLLPRAESLKGLILKCRLKDLEFNQVVQFALNTVNGSLSLMFHATQNMTKSYNPTGAVQQSFSPKRSRSETVLKEA
ncbi:flagellar export chaperone FlgN [Oligoflexia bacterium]|nr:flagellar export chaperone FlgN [Oligoflexia bacterium]